MKRYNYNRTPQRRIVFQGDSLLETGAHYIPYRCYSGINATSYGKGLTSLDLSGKQILTILSEFSSKEAITIRPNDIVILFMTIAHYGGGSQTAQGCYDNFVLYSNQVRALGGKIILCTCAARDGVGDPAWYETERPILNTLFRNNQATICDGLADIGASTLFDATADASNGTYYNADKIHFVVAGEDVIADSYIIPAINTLL